MSDWATWGPPCLEEIPDLVDFHQRHKTFDAVVVTVSVEDIAPERRAQLVDPYLMSYPVLRSEPLPKTPLEPIPDLCTTFPIDPNGDHLAPTVCPFTGEPPENCLEGKKQGRHEARGDAS